MAEKWGQEIVLAAKNPDAAKKVVEKFDKWKKTKTFEDRDMAAKIHLIAALLLQPGPTTARRPPRSAKKVWPMSRTTRKCGAGWKCSAGTSAAKGLIPFGSGTGFCVAQGNYVLTNHHVIARAKEIKVHLNGDQTRYPAELIADEKAGDMALLKIDLPAGKAAYAHPLGGKPAWGPATRCVPWAFPE